jgi:hypothetical protein
MMPSYEEFSECSACGFDRNGLKPKNLPPPVPVPCDIKTKPVIHSIGKLRDEFNEKDLKERAHDNDWGNKTSLETHIEGAFGEYAYEVLTGAPMDKSIGRRNPYDFKHGDLEVDVKCSKNGNYVYVKKRRLKGHEHDNYAYVAVKGDPDTYNAEFTGWITGKEFSNLGTEYPNNPDTLSVPVSSLHPMSELYDKLKKGGHLNGQGVWK